MAGLMTPESRAMMKIGIKLFAAATVVALGVTLSGQGAAPATTARLHSPASKPPAFSTERLARIDRVLQQWVDGNELAGAVALVLQDGKPVYERAVGWSDKEAGRKMTPDTIFRIASQTKALTSVAILMLMEEGKINLTDPVSNFISAYASTKVAVRGDTGITVVPAKRRITIRDLLTHTAGISYGTSSDVASLYEQKGLGPAARAGTPPTRMSRSARRWNGWHRCRLSRSRARPGCTA